MQFVRTVIIIIVDDAETGERRLCLSRYSLFRHAETAKRHMPFVRN
jgi:hypothetical protein